MPAFLAGGALEGDNLGTVMGMRVAGRAVGAVGRGLEKVEVDAVHGFRPA